MRRALLLTSGVLTLLTAALVAWLDVDAPPAATPRFTLALDGERAWRLRWRSTDRAAVGGALETSQLALTGTLRVRPAGERVLEARLEGVEVEALSFLGQPVPAAGALLERTVRLELDAQGRLTALSAEPDAEPLAVHLLSALHDELRVDLEAAAGRARVETPNRWGVAEWAYADAPAGFRRSLQTQRSVHGLGAAEGPRGVTVSARGEDSVGWDGYFTSRASVLHLEARRDGALALESDEELTLTPAPVPATTWERPATFVAHHRFAPSAGAEQAAREQRIAGLTAQAFLDDLGNFGRTGQLPDHNRWLRRAVALLASNPALLAEVERFFAAPGGTAAGRVLALDLLTHAQTPEAQAALVRVLGGETARRDPAWPLYVQRLSLVSAPTKETTAFALQAFSAARSRDDVGATATMLGALAGHLPAEDSARASELTRRLQDGFARADGADGRATWLTALGATGRAEVLPQLQAGAKDESPLVRATAARALGGLGGAAQDVLEALAVDRDARVREAAISTLSPSTSVATLSTLLTAAPADIAADHAWVTALTPRLAEPGVRELLAQVLARTSEPQLAARIRTLLEG